MFAQPARPPAARVTLLLCVWVDMNEWGGFCTAAVEAAVADQSVDWIPPMLLLLSMR